jgi:hypothetical protein
MLSRPAFQFFLFGLGLVLVHWPFLYWPESWREPNAYLYLFLIWSLLVLVLWLVSRSLGPHLPRSRELKEEEPASPVDEAGRQGEET